MMIILFFLEAADVVRFGCRPPVTARVPKSFFEQSIEGYQSKLDAFDNDLSAWIDRQKELEKLGRADDIPSGIEMVGHPLIMLRMRFGLEKDRKKEQDLIGFMNENIFEEELVAAFEKYKNVIRKNEQSTPELMVHLKNKATLLLKNLSLLLPSEDVFFKELVGWIRRKEALPQSEKKGMPRSQSIQDEHNNFYKYIKDAEEFLLKATVTPDELYDKIKEIKQTIQLTRESLPKLKNDIEVYKAAIIEKETRLQKKYLET